LQQSTGGRTIKWVLWLKILYTGFVVVLIPAYFWHYGPGNFLWLSDIALFAGLVALWLRVPLLAGMQAIAVLVPELTWNLDLLLRLTLDVRLLGMTDYMFMTSIPLFIRLLSLFHVWLPIVLVWMVWKFGYDRRAFVWQTAAGTLTLVASYLFTSPDVNINVVHQVGPLRGLQSLALTCVLFPLLCYLPAHHLFRARIPPPQRG
jgi:hypothetical protein